MIDRPDLDPQDLANRIALRESLRQIRRDQGLSGRTLSVNAGWNGWAVEHLETQTNWGVTRVQRWARALDHRLHLTIVGLDVPEEDLHAVVLRAVTAFGGADEDQLHVRQIVDDLARIRCHQGLSRAVFAARVRTGDRAVQGWEDNPTRCLIKTVQRYARGLGGHLDLAVQPVTVAVAA